MTLASIEKPPSGVRHEGAPLAPARERLASMTAALLSLQEPVPKAARSICEILVAGLGCMAARLWLFNPHFAEFDLLGQYCDGRYAVAFEVRKNRLPLAGSTAGKSFAAGTVERVIDSLSNLLSIDDPTRTPPK